MALTLTLTLTFTLTLTLTLTYIDDIDIDIDVDVDVDVDIDIDIDTDIDGTSKPVDRSALFKGAKGESTVVQRCVNCVTDGQLGNRTEQVGHRKIDVHNCNTGVRQH